MSLQSIFYNQKFFKMQFISHYKENIENKLWYSRQILVEIVCCGQVFLGENKIEKREELWYHETIQLLI